MFSFVVFFFLIFLQSSFSNTETNSIDRSRLDFNQVEIEIEDCESAKYLSQNKDIIGDYFLWRTLFLCKGEDNFFKDRMVTYSPPSWLEGIWWTTYLPVVFSRFPEDVWVNEYKRAPWDRIPMEQAEKLMTEALKKVYIPKLQKKLFQMAPSYAPEQENTSVESVLDRSRDFHRRGLWNEGRLVLESALQGLKESSEAWWTLMLELAEYEKRLGEREASAKRISDVAKSQAKFLKKTKSGLTFEKYAETEIAASRAIWTLGRRSEAEQRLKMLKAQKPSGVRIPLIFYLLARMSEDAGENTKALDYYSLLLEQKQSFRVGLRTLADTLWRVSWLYIGMKEWHKAKEFLERLVKIEDRPTALSRARYWLGMTLKKVDDQDAANRLFEKIQNEDPLGYYQILVRRETQRPFRPKLQKKILSLPVALEKLKDFSNHEKRLIFKLHEWGDHQIARQLFNYLRSKKEYSKTDPRVLKIMALLGDYLEVFFALYQIPPDDRHALLKNNLDLLFPRPYLERVKESCEDAGCQSAFIYSIMRQESGFVSDARSHMDAFGLMQLIEPMAKNGAKLAKIPYHGIESLFDPAINIRLGAFHWQSLWQEFEGRFVLAAAAYNATPQRVKRWVKHRYRGDLPTFIENIPFEETRNYVKLVIRNAIFYKKLMAEAPFLFPESTLFLTPDEE